MTVYILFAIGFVVLIKGADILVDGSVAIAKKLHVSNIAIGLTIVAFGTSAPELMVNIIASAKGNTDIAIGNILGSNIANILLILGISAIICPIAAKKNTVLKEIPLSLLAAIVLGVMANDRIIDGGGFSGLTRVDGIILICFFMVFLSYIFTIAKSSDEIPSDVKIKEMGYLKAIVFICLGFTGLTLGGKWIVDGAVKIAELFNVSQSLIGLTVVAIGTSLPELATSAVAAFKKETDIAIGNVVGSNIFNIFWVLGVSSIIRPLPFNSGLNFDIIMTVFASLFLFLAMFIGQKHTIGRWKGLLMFTIYILYVSALVYKG